MVPGEVTEEDGWAGSPGIPVADLVGSGAYDVEPEGSGVVIRIPGYLVASEWIEGGAPDPVEPVDLALSVPVHRGVLVMAMCRIEARRSRGGDVAALTPEGKREVERAVLVQISRTVESYARVSERVGLAPATPLEEAVLSVASSADPDGEVLSALREAASKFAESCGSGLGRGGMEAFVLMAMTAYSTYERESQHSGPGTGAAAEPPAGGTAGANHPGP